MTDKRWGVCLAEYCVPPLPRRFGAGERLVFAGDSQKEQDTDLCRAVLAYQGNHLGREGFDFPAEARYSIRLCA
jgi:hypothetical protein